MNDKGRYLAVKPKRNTKRLIDHAPEPRLTDLNAMEPQDQLSLYVSIVEEQSDLICRFGPDTRLTFVNHAFCRHFCRSREELLGNSFLNLVFETDQGEMLQQMQTMDKDHPQSVRERRMCMPDGSISWHTWTDRALFNEMGQVIGFQSVGRDITDRKEAEEKVRYLQFHDPLTGSYNRAFFNVELRRLDVVRQLPISIISGNINGLKLVNSTFGYPAGDRMIINTNRILKQCCREEDIVARLGGDQYVVLLCKTSHETAYEVCERIRKTCREADADPIQPSIALGVATKDTTGKSVNEVMSEAEDVMLQSKLLESRSTRNAIISSLETTLHEKTVETKEHAERLQHLSLQFGKAVGLASDLLDRLALLAKLHDIGKIAVPEQILSKPGPLNSMEWEVIKKHPEVGFRIAQSSRDLAVLAVEVLTHHERWDGSGYPRGLQGEEIPLLSRIISIVDAFDVMTHERSYKTAISKNEAMDEIIRCSGTQFDPNLVPIFTQMIQ